MQLQVQENVDDVDGINLAQAREKLRHPVNTTDLMVSYNAGNFVPAVKLQASEGLYSMKLGC